MAPLHRETSMRKIQIIAAALLLAALPLAHAKTRTRPKHPAG